jgi:hypothetical protein
MTKQQAYYQLRRAQAHIVQYNIFNTGELLKYIEKEYVKIYAKYLTDFYFHRSKKLVIYNLVYDLYRLFLVIAPILQKQKNSFKLDWNRAVFLGWLRNNLNKKLNRKFVKIETLQRKIDNEKLLQNFLKIGINDELFLEFALDCFKKNYALQTLRGRLANCIFDPIIFFSDKGEKGFRRANEIIRLEKKKFHGCVDIDKKEIVVWDYKIKRETNFILKKTTLNIQISNKDIKKFREKIKDILHSKLSPNKKVLVLKKEIESFTDKHRYTKDAFDQMLDLKYWLTRKTKKLSGTDKTFKLTTNIIEKWKDKMSIEIFLRKPNFFWNIQEIKEENYKYFFSPYREE